MSDDDDPWEEAERDDGLGSLAQSARATGLGQARVILIAVGVLNGMFDGLAFLFVEDLVGRGRLDDEDVRVVRLILIGGLLIDALFVCLGVAVYAAPVACTAAGLTIYLALIAVIAAVNPLSLVNPCAAVVRVLVVVGLVKAVATAAAYEKARREERRRESRGGRWDDDE